MNLFSGYFIKFFCFIAILFLQNNLYAHGPHGRSANINLNNANANTSEQIKFIENNGQWKAQFDYKLELHGGAMFFEKNALTYSFLSSTDIDKLQSAKTGQGSRTLPADWTVDAHAFRVNFKNALSTVKITADDAFSDYRNYYLGNNSRQWATGVRSYQSILYSGLYDGVDLKFYSANTAAAGKSLKYDFVVHAGHDASDIHLEYNGLNKMQVQNGNLYLVTSVNSVIEQKPYAYQVINGQKVTVPCNYKLIGNELTFDFPSGYNNNHELIIDPVLEFSTYTGSTSDNFGFTATYDLDGNLYAGGIVFGIGYPTTIGAYQVNYAGQVDVGISKFSPDGSSLIYSTYLGGVDTELPSSLIVNSANELIVMGTTGSSDFPTSLNGYDRTFNGGTSASFPNNGATFNNGTDIFVTKFNTAGTALLGSTYMGGSANDGINHNSTAQLQYNYGDQFRGEVIVDEQDNIYVASSTLSSNFPTTAGVFQAASSGGQEAVVFKFNTNLSTLQWSSYLGGSGVDAGYSLKLDNSNDLLVCGGTTSSNLANTSGALNTTYQGGAADGYVSKINNSGTQLIRSTYIGTSAYDQAYFVETDRMNNVYLYGQSRGIYPLTPGVYSNFNTKQFIHKLDNSLSSTLFSTTFGAGTSVPNISPTAFLVDVCGYIYASGWGGNVNTSWNSQTGTTNGMPVSGDAFQSTTDGSDFYFIVLGPDATFLEYATFFGGNGSAEHVDGGTSRFDKRGAIYQAVCAGCGGNSLFPTTPGVWSNTNNSSNCNLGAIKFDFQINSVNVDVSTSSTQGCAPLTIQFDDNDTSAVSYFWDFGNGDTANVKSPSYIFDQPGTYDVTLIGFDSTACVGVVLSDTAYATIEVLSRQSDTVDV
ncbi:MAG: PKD domain-containing protein, partial [Chitinophagales bacterium]